MNRAHHLQEERLWDCYLAERGGETLDPPLGEHLADCDECGRRYTEITEFMDALGAEAAAETDAVFTPERLRMQQQHIARRLEHLGHPARVITFPGRASSHHVSPAVPRMARRWIAAAAAAGLFIGVGAGVFFDWGASRAAGTRRAAAVTRQPLLTVQAALSDLSEADADEAFLSELEVALERPRTRELAPFDALTPHLREITNSLR